MVIDSRGIAGPGDVGVLLTTGETNGGGIIGITGGGEGNPAGSVWYGVAKV